MNRIVIGEGGYGCVHKPSIHCKKPPKPNFNYTNYVSKIMANKEAVTELHEFVIIEKIDPKNEYHLDTPILCEPDLDEPNVKKNIEKCKNIKLTDIEAKPSDYGILVLKYGGPDLKAFTKSYMKKYFAQNTTVKVDQFWLEVHHLIKGLKFFKEHGLVHNDIKPHNILYDFKNGTMKYIDFGLMRPKKAVLNASKKDTNFLACFHWSYPLDCGFMNKSGYVLYKTLTNVKRENLKSQLSDLIILGNSNTNIFKFPIKNPKSFEIVFSYLNPDGSIPNASIQQGYIDTFFNGFNQLISKKSYTKALDMFTDSIDVYGLGITLQFMANNFKQKNLLPLDDYTRLTTFFHKMYDFNPLTRVIDIDALLTEYETILLENGVLIRLKKSFKDHNLIDAPPVSTAIMRQAKIDDSSTPSHLSKELEKFAEKDVVEINDCPQGKERNPLTKRCVNKCFAGYYRNDKFKCVKNRKNKEEKDTSCPQGKERNPLTKRCVKNCLTGYYRNDKFKCVKTRKNKDTDTSCPQGKERNPLTKRCVNKCKTGYYRNDKFKCVKTRKNKDKKE